MKGGRSFLIGQKKEKNYKTKMAKASKTQEREEIMHRTLEKRLPTGG